MREEDIEWYKNTGIKLRVIEEIRQMAEKNAADKIVLFGSRARGDFSEKSDIDLAVYGCKEFGELAAQLEENLWSLLELDIINMDSLYISEELVREIEKDGVTIYEKV